MSFFSGISMYTKPYLLKLHVRHKMITRSLKICVLGALGGVGQPVSLLLKQSSFFEEVALFDLKTCAGLALELNQIDTPTKVISHETIKPALKGSQIVLNLAGTGSATDANKLFAVNGKAVTDTTLEVAQHCPKAFHVLLADPLNSMLPIAFEVYKKVLGCMEPGRVLGMTEVDVFRTCSILADVTHVAPEELSVPVVGGHSRATTVPLLSRAEPCISLTTDETVRITRYVQDGVEDVRKSKEGAGAPRFAASVALVKMAENLARGLLGQKGVVVCAYVLSNLVPGVKYFASPVELGPTGLQKILPLPNPLSNYECCLLESALEILKKDIQKGEEFHIS